MELVLESGKKLAVFLYHLNFSIIVCPSSCKTNTVFPISSSTDLSVAVCFVWASCVLEDV